MAAITKRLLHLRPTSYSLTRPYPYTHRHFSSDNDDAPKPQTPSSVSSSLNDVRASLQNVPSPPSADRRQPPRSQFSFLSGAPSETSPPSEPRGIHQRLAEFRSRSESPSPPTPDGDKYVSLSKLYEKNFKSKGESSGAPSGGVNRPFDAIRESLTNLESAGAANSGRKPGEHISLSSFTAGLNLKTDGRLVGVNWLNTAKGKGDIRPQFENTVDSADLGKKLQSLRPEKRKGKWFSFQELSNRLAKVRMIECEEHEEREKKLGLPPGLGLGLGGFKKLEKEADMKTKERAQRVTVGVAGFINEALNEKTGPPKENLIENYFHPDNMSSAEKLKLELAKVRDEFKMSESDCGSARVQVAQLTTKIKHLSTALHKKDKHSRRGLKAMVERRKKLLKYIRRTDWDSYHLLLSKLGLRDNPDSKA